MNKEREIQIEKLTSEAIMYSIVAPYKTHSKKWWRWIVAKVVDEGFGDKSRFEIKFNPKLFEGLGAPDIKPIGYKDEDDELS